MLFIAFDRPMVIFETNKNVLQVCIIKCIKCTKLADAVVLRLVCYTCVDRNVYCGVSLN